MSLSGFGRAVIRLAAQLDSLVLVEEVGVVERSGVERRLGSQKANASKP